MKRIIRFHKGFLPATIFSVCLMLFGVVGILVKGFNMGVDFKAGVNQYIQLAYPAADISYTGTGTPNLKITETVFQVVFTGANVEQRSVTYDLTKFATINDLAAELAKESIVLTGRDGGALSPKLLVPTYQGEFLLSTTPGLLHRTPRDAGEAFGSIEEVRKAVDPIGSVAVQTYGKKDSLQYVVRVSQEGDENDFIGRIPVVIRAALEKSFGAEKVVFMKNDSIGAKFSEDLGGLSWKVTVLTILVILIYSWVRFKLQFGMGAVLAIVHDAMAIVTFIVWSGMEFNTLSIAAILTILGYSINDTIVIFDRIRENMKLSPTDKMTTILDRSVTEMLGRTIITTGATLLAVFALYFFTEGSMKDFALALVVGMISGTYSTIYIATAFISYWETIKQKRIAADMAKRNNTLASTPKLAKTTK